MKRHRRSFSLFITLFLVLASLSASMYPSLDIPFTNESGKSSEVNTEFLSDFLSQWEMPDAQMNRAIEDVIRAENRTLRTLESVAEIQRLSLERVKAGQRPTLSVNSAPLYSYIDDTSLTGAPPATTITNHSFGFNGALSQSLMTGGSLSVQLSSMSSLITDDGGTTWTWNQSPSASLSLTQPIGINDKVLDFNYGNHVLETSELAYESALMSVEDTAQELSREALSLLQGYQALRESRFLLIKEYEIQENRVQDAIENEAKGLISRNDLLAEKQRLSTLALQITNMESEIASLEETLTLFSSDPETRSFPLATSSLESIEDLFLLYGSTLDSDPFYEQRALETDSAYMQAQLDYKAAQAQYAQGSPSDAPSFTLSVNYEPFSNPAPGSSFSDSIGDLFSSSTEHNVRVSFLFNAPDVFRKTRRAQTGQLDQQLVQAQLAVKEAEEQVKASLKTLQLRINGAFDALELKISEYTLARTQAEDEQIRLEYGLSDEYQVARKEIAMYQSAFSLLDSLRTLTVLAQEVSPLLN
ncbi:MAG: TolC family protein [Sphaerochaetaceae bacterium]|nr:TolC family protein [Sphaerochaetaceae bacterium]